MDGSGLERREKKRPKSWKAAATAFRDGARGVCVVYTTSERGKVVAFHVTDASGAGGAGWSLLRKDRPEAAAGRKVACCRTCRSRIGEKNKTWRGMKTSQMKNPEASSCLGLRIREPTVDFLLVVRLSPSIRHQSTMCLQPPSPRRPSPALTSLTTNMLEPNGLASK